MVRIGNKMFCKWCGNKITNNGKPCPTCGKEQDTLESGNGFWDLYKNESELNKQNLNFRDASHNSPMNDEKKIQATCNFNQKQRNRIVSLTTGNFFLTLLILIGSLVTLYQFSKGITKIDRVQSELSSLQTTISNERVEMVEHLAETLQTHGLSVSENSTDSNTEDILDDLEEILAIEGLSVIDNGKMSIESHEIQSSLANQVLIVTGIPTESEDTKIIWQQYDEQTGHWEIIAQDQLYILVNINDNMSQIRALSLSLNDFGQNVISVANYPLSEDSKESFEHD